MDWKPVGMRPSDYVAEMHAAMEHKLYISALNAALIIPDVCATALDEGNWTNGGKYIAWVNRYLKPELERLGCSELSAGDVYQLRNSVLHNGSLATNAGKACSYHNIRVHVFESISQVTIGAGSVGLGEECSEGDRERHLTINLTAFVRCVDAAVVMFLASHPECNRDTSKGRLVYGGLVDFTIAGSRPLR